MSVRLALAGSPWHGPVHRAPCGRGAGALRRSGAKAQRPCGAATRWACRARTQRGFTLLELVVALALVALMASVLYGALGFAGTAVDKGEAKAEANASMRLTEEFLRQQLEGQHPLRMRRMAEFPLLFGGTRDELRYAAPLPLRVSAGGMWYFRLRVDHDDARSPLVLERMVPDLAAARLPDFTTPERSILAEDIGEIRIAYLGLDPHADKSETPTWRDRWDDAQRLPQLLRIEVIPRHGPPWPPLVVAPRESPEAGCRAFDPARQACVAV
jgi:general secretion pathway protein J